jgi:hypothetical protein
VAQRIGAVTNQGRVGNVNVLTGTLTDPTTHSTTVVNTGDTDYIDCAGYNRISIYCVNGATNSVVFTIKGSLDGTNFETISYKLLDSATAIESNITVTAGNKDVVHIPPSSYFRYYCVAVGTANAVGTTFTLYAESS